MMSTQPFPPEDIRWYSREALPWGIPTDWAPWLLHTGSLTQHLKGLCKNSFTVQLLKQGWQTPHPDESRFLEMPAARLANIREVLLICDGIPQVFARSILPAELLQGRARCLLSLGNRPLGEFLFSRPCTQRHLVGFSRTRNGHNQPLWGRRSLFTLPEGDLSVYEYFLHGHPPHLNQHKEDHCGSEV